MALQRIKSITPNSSELDVYYYGAITAIGCSFKISSDVELDSEILLFISTPTTSPIPIMFGFTYAQENEISISYMDYSAGVMGVGTATIVANEINEIVFDGTLKVNNTPVTLTFGGTEISTDGFVTAMSNASNTQGISVVDVVSIYRYKLSNNYYFPQIDTATNVLSFTGDNDSKTSTCDGCVYEDFVVTFNAQPQSCSIEFNDTMNPLTVSATPCESVSWKKSSDGSAWTSVGTGTQYTPTKEVGTRYYKAEIYNEFLGGGYTRDSNIASVSVSYNLAQMVYDRADSDVEYANTIKGKIKNGTNTSEELQWWLSTTSKGRYNYTDLNRVSNGLIEAKILCESIGIAITYQYTIKTDYDGDDVLTTTDVSHILANVTTLKTALATWIHTTVPITIKSVIDANNIEYIIYQVEGIVESVKQVYRYSAEMYSGEQY